MVHAGCVFVAGIHSSRTSMNVRIFWVNGMECMRARTRPQFILSSEEVFWGMESEPTLTAREKSPVCVYQKNSPQRRIEPMTLHQAGQRARHTTYTMGTAVHGSNQLSHLHTCLVILKTHEHKRAHQCGKTVINDHQTDTYQYHWFDLSKSELEQVYRRYADKLFLMSHNFNAFLYSYAQKRSLQ